METEYCTDLDYLNEIDKITFETVQKFVNNFFYVSFFFLQKYTPEKRAYQLPIGTNTLRLVFLQFEKKNHNITFSE